VNGRDRPPGAVDYLPLPQSLPTTRTELTRRCCPPCADIDPEAEPVDPLVVPPVVPPVVPLVVPPVEPVVDPLPVLVDPEAEPLPDIDPDPLASVPVTSTRLPTFDVSSDELPSSV